MKIQWLILLMMLLPACQNAERFGNGQVAPPAVGGCGGTCDHGNEQGNGSDYYHIGDGSAWFLDSGKTIKYCIQISPAFGVSEDQAATQIEIAFSRWQQYIAAKQILTMRPSAVHLTTNHTRLATCDGSEDLAFYLGVHNPQTNSYGAAIDGQVGVAVRMNYDEFKGWGKGFIWIAGLGTVTPDYTFGQPSRYPDWTIHDNLAAILTHELGHMYGVEHVNGTIMRKDIANQLKTSDAKNTWDPNVLTSIDDAQELAICDSCNLIYDGSLGFAMSHTTNGTTTVDDTITPAFTELTGHAPVGGVKAVSAQLTGDIVTGFVLEVRDAKDHLSYPVTFDYKNRISYEDDIDVFKTLLGSRSTDGDGLPATYETTDIDPHVGYVASGSLVTSTGETLSVQLDRNMTNPFAHAMMLDSPLVMSYAQGASIQPLFVGQDPLLSAEGQK